MDKKVIDEIVKDLQRALIQADVNVHLAKELGEKIRKEAENERITGIERKEHLTKILHDELIKILGGEKKELKFKVLLQQRILLKLLCLNNHLFLNLRVNIQWLLVCLMV